jgi:hypothetical protein
MARQLVDIADLDCIYLSYDEPQKEEFWIKIQNMVPWAKRVDGVKGSDAAHKAAAAASDTERFILIDGDNIPDAEFFDLQLDIKEEYNDCVYRWKARNHINGLMYGNGGLSCWTKTFVNNMRTHEASDGSSDTAVEFCFDNKYIAMHNVYSTTYPNGSEYHAWRAGFREGVKLCLAKGEKPTPDNFDEIVNKQNIQNLLIWMSVGADVEHGLAAIHGARFGAFKLLVNHISEWDYTTVQDFDEIQKLVGIANGYDSGGLADQLKLRYNLPIVDYNEEQSKFFKQVMLSAHIQLDPMTTERDVQGW